MKALLYVVLERFNGIQRDLATLQTKLELSSMPTDGANADQLLFTKPPPQLELQFKDLHEQTIPTRLIARTVLHLPPHPKPNMPEISPRHVKLTCTLLRTRSSFSLPILWTEPLNTSLSVFHASGALMSADTYAVDGDDDGDRETLPLPAGCLT
ncbi:hypothetical protein GALMADRAFT_147037 [Galerina marginata CBS 339.88]|uniref:Uncharacterized protein n=1 Tax=Galerina marginata (strain CBS 339.88) TaxID=685588 RepID=A0A067SL70_GALM3|nr:hypothetical protein GALMADRAFT_147037 [Galerina marginata CBS 339.88]